MNTGAAEFDGHEFYKWGVLIGKVLWFPSRTEHMG